MFVILKNRFNNNIYIFNKNLKIVRFLRAKFVGILFFKTIMTSFQK